MKLTVIGAASAYSSKPGRSSSCYLVEHNDTAVLLDLGQGSFSELWRYRSPAKVAAVFISHMHADHNVDLVPLRHWVKFANRGYGPALFGPSDIRPRYNAFQADSDFFDDFRGASLDIGITRVGDLTIEAARVTHIPDSFAFRVGTGDGAGLVYSGDCGVPDDLLPLIHPNDAFLCEAGFGVRREAPGIHLTAGEAGSVAAQGQVARLVLTHVHDRANADEMLGAARDEFGGDVDLAQPGMTIALA